MWEKEKIRDDLGGNAYGTLCVESRCQRGDAGGVQAHSIWPELKAVLREAGIRNYTIWNVGNELFGYYECEKGCAYAARVQAESPVVDKWNEYMKDVMVMEMDPATGAQPMLTRVFLME